MPCPPGAHTTNTCRPQQLNASLAIFPAFNSRTFPSYIVAKKILPSSFAEFSSMENERQADPINDETEMKGGSESGESMEYVRVDCANETEEADLEEGKQQNECVPIEDPVSHDVGNSENAAPISLDAISSAEVPVVVKSSEQEVINMLLAQHGILPSGTALEVPTFTVQHSPTSITSDGNQGDGTKGQDIGLPTMVTTTSATQETLEGESARTDGKQSNELPEQIEAHNAAYLSSMNAPEIVTTFVAEDGQGGHIIISGGPEYQDNSVVAISGQQVSTVAEGQLMTIASGENAPVSIAALDSFTSDHVHMASGADDEGAGTATSYYVLEDHVAMVDGQSHMDGNDQEPSKKIYQCTMDGCGKQFSTPYRLKAHGRSHTGQTFSCDEDGCHKTFITPSDLNKHSRTHSGDKPFFCDYENCGKVYSTAHHLKVHKRSHTGDKPFVCEWETCGKSFSTGYGLKSHYRTHTGERPYKCPEDTCDKAFKTSGDLQKHVRTHTGERPFNCPYEGCTRSFTTSNIRKVHMRTHTGERPYVCEIEGCNRSFASATNYKNHSRIHTGERPYSCEVPGCNKSFTEYSSLYKHNVVHTQQKPYICSICHKTYRQTSTLAMHKRTVHGTADECMAENEAAEEHDQDGEPTSKRQKVAYDSNGALTTALVQGLPVMLNDEGTMNALQTHYAELAAQQQITDGSALSGAIAIPIQVTMNPDGTIAGAHGINLTDSSGRIIPVSLSLSLPISSFGNSLTTSSQTEESIVTSEAVAAASAVNEIFTNQQSETSIDVQLSAGQVITEQIENADVIAPQDEHSEPKATYENDPMIATEGLNSSQILITTVSDTHALMTSDSDATTVRIAPRDYSSNEAEMKNIERPEADTASTTNMNSETREEGAVSMIIGEDIAREHDEGDVTDRYLIKEGFEVRESRQNAKAGNQV